MLCGQTRIRFFQKIFKGDVSISKMLFVGLSDELANDFKVKQALQKVTRLDANGRIQRYSEFAADLSK